MNEITVDQWRAALEKAGQPEGGFYNVWELTDMLGIGADRVRMTIAALSRAGRIEVQKVKRPCIDGSLRWIPVYKIKPEVKAS